ncbi:ABC transporter ATP-binding protein [Nesterenkonia ebinurensis]|uniref:ABC transporter ATP-binding protein n=1 Tax=Nesterenkonia ebinurensis TaxID=2608252 RepID=UPI00123D6E6F|nr:oligopeptide/dipeptide ABC transporter ATP-binding protein [Nesterenkonia ebinurensis]
MTEAIEHLHSTTEASAQEPLITVRHLTKKFTLRGPRPKASAKDEQGKASDQAQERQSPRNELVAVNNISFDVYPGETLGLVGESGSGKSTTAALILRLLEATSGEVYFEGQNLLELPPQEMRRRRRDMQMVFQDPFSSLNPRMRVGEIIEEPLRTHRTLPTRRGRRDRVLDLMDTVGLSPDFVDRFPHEFSGGQRQRIGIARALALNPKLIVCDEAVSALDVSIQAQVLNLLKKLQAEFNLTYIFIGHGLPAVHHISDRIAVMYLGKIVEITTRDSLFDDPKHPYTKALLDSSPVSSPELRGSQDELLEGEVPSLDITPRGCPFNTRCLYVQDRCRSEEPPLRSLSDTAQAACHFPLNHN